MHRKFKKAKTKYFDDHEFNLLLSVPSSGFVSSVVTLGVLTSVTGCFSGIGAGTGGATRTVVGVSGARA